MRTTIAIALLACAQTAYAQDHSQHQHQQTPPATTTATADEHAHRAQGDEGKADGYRPPALTDADRAAAFPDLSDHDMRVHMDDNPFVWTVIADRLEWQRGDDARAIAWDAKAWFGNDDHRLWLRSEGTRERGHGTVASAGRVDGVGSHDRLPRRRWPHRLAG
ncbi:MAG: hypothetical protein EOP93_07210 [Lysobacteraceae bacterium]|nr:MAG: hypothetical protein EOP93_07210 [Xanthomonadaceae bacterium]